jgi:type II secretory pathway pseudopilin PulG
MNRSEGFSIIEALIATMILGVLIIAILGPLGGLFRMSKSNQQLLDNTTLAQHAAERIVREWHDPDRFEQGCLDLSSEPLPPGVTVTVQPLDTKATVSGPAQAVSDCPGTPLPAPLKRVTVRADAGGPKAEIVLDVLRPDGAGGP